jgi:hypothetical protein
VRSSFHILRSQTHLGRYRGRRVPIICFALLNSFSAVTGAYGPVFIFFAPGLILGGTEGTGVSFSCFAFPDSFRGYQGRRVAFLSFALPDLFSTVLRASGPVFIFCALRLFLGGTVFFPDSF